MVFFRYINEMIDYPEMWLSISVAFITLLLTASDFSSLSSLHFKWRYFSLSAPTASKEEGFRLRSALSTSEKNVEHLTEV